jgi:orotidine-5'-phosphate decarboxylase
MPSARAREGDVIASFGDRVAAHVSARASQLVLGLDPDPARLWPRALELAAGAGTPAFELAGAVEAPPAARAAFAVAIHCTLLMDAVGEHCVAVKPQVACFERLGGPGWAALREVVVRAHEHDLLVIADAKRGDVEVTATAYAQAYFGATPTPYGEVEGLGIDALTANPLLGVDSLQPLIDHAREHGAGLFVLVRTSNRGAADVQEQPLASAAAEGTVSDRLARIVAQLGEPGIGSSGLSDVGAVVGATAPERLEALRTLMPAAVFLLPGVGAQGGRIEELAPAFAPGRAGGLVSASRSISSAYERTGGDPGTAARDEAARLRELAWKLSS